MKYYSSFRAYPYQYFLSKGINLHFLAIRCNQTIGGKNSEYAIKTSYTDSVGREGNYFINNSEIDLWKRISNHMKEEYSHEFSIIDWEKEEEESLVWEPYIPVEELPF